MTSPPAPAPPSAPPARPAVRVILVDDQTLVRQGIRSLLGLVDHIEVVGEAGDGREALDVIAATSPDVVLLDLRMPRLDGLGTLRELARGDAVGPVPAVLVLTTFDDDEAVLSALRAGARGYLLKDVTLTALVEAIDVLAAGGRLVQPAVTATLLSHLVDGETAGAAAAAGERFEPLGAQTLTARETEVLRLMAAGYANREIAAALHLAEGTVKNHVSGILLKLGVRDRTRAVLRGLELGLVAG